VAVSFTETKQATLNKTKHRKQVMHGEEEWSWDETERNLPSAV